MLNGGHLLMSHYEYTPLAYVTTSSKLRKGGLIFQVLHYKEVAAKTFMVTYQLCSFLPKKF